jgi:hypothetical protein
MSIIYENPTYIILAYAGLLIHVLMRVAEISKVEVSAGFRSYVKEHRYNLIASVIMLPVLLVVATDTSLSEILPLNYVTAVLAGWQTDATFKALMALGSSKLKK